MSKTTYESLDNKIAASTLTKDLTKGLDVVDGHGIKKLGEYENPDELYDMLIARIRKYHPSTDVSMIEKAYALAKEAHGDQCRKSGEPYIVHPLWVAIILANLELQNSDDYPILPINWKYRRRISVRCFLPWQKTSVLSLSNWLTVCITCGHCSL